MGRRARTNCSPVDAVLEKYHSDIGNRLSGVFIPPPTTEGGQPLSDDFSMLTLDLRRSHSVKVRGQKGDLSAQTILNNSQAVETASNKPADTPNADPARRSTMPRTGSPAPTDSGSDGAGATRDKTRLVDKLTRALFQKKHVCARCKRKSRTCVLNKTLNVAEKRYTCGRCRENSSALKNFFDGQTGLGENQDASSFCSLSSSSSNKRDGSGVPQPRVGNDSGYETVTSCSTVASSFSAFNTPNSNNTSRKENLALDTESTHPDAQELSLAADRGCQDSTPVVGRMQQRCPCQEETPHHIDCSSQINQAQTGDFRVPYDGYLPDFIEFRGWARQVLRPCSQGDSSACELGDGDDNDNADSSSGAGIICVRRPTSLDSSPRPARKACHTCGTTSVPCFRLPWEGGWLCEDCMDGIY